MLSNLIFIQYSILFYSILHYICLFYDLFICYAFVTQFCASFCSWLVVQAVLWIRTVAKRGALQQKWSKTPLSAISLLTHTDQPPDRCVKWFCKGQIRLHKPTGMLNPHIFPCVDFLSDV